MEAHISMIMQHASQRSRVASVDESDKLITEEELGHASYHDPEYRRLIQAVSS